MGPWREGGTSRAGLGTWAESEALPPAWVLSTAQQGPRVSRVLAAKPLTLALWLSQTEAGRCPPTPQHCARAFARDFLSLSHPCQTVSLTP